MKEQTQTVVGILGAVHTDEMRLILGYSLDMLRDVILEFDPDVICGEVRPEDWARYQEDQTYPGYLGPSEYRGCIIPLCEEKGIEFVPVDWFEDDLTQLDYERGLTSEEIKNSDKELERLYDVIFQEAKTSSIPFNSKDCDLAVKRKMKWLEQLNPTCYNLDVVVRNQIMVERIRKAIEKHRGKPILLIAGAEHNVFYYEALKNEDSVKLVYPLR